MFKFKYLIFFIALFTGTILKAQVIPGEVSFISSKKEKGSFTISSSGKSSPILFSSEDYPGVIRALKDLQNDIGKVTSIIPELSSDIIPKEKELIIVGTICKSEIMDILYRQ